MQPSRKFANPFYGLILITGLAFVLTTICYGVMAFRDARPAPAAAEAAENADHPLMVWMRQNGDAALVVQLVFLAIFTFAAIGTDGFWQRQANLRNEKQDSRRSPNPFKSGPE